jgi:hypothetical protein
MGLRWTFQCDNTESPPPDFLSCRHVYFPSVSPPMVSPLVLNRALDANKADHGSLGVLGGCRRSLYTGTKRLRGFHRATTARKAVTCVPCGIFVKSRWRRTAPRCCQPASDGWAAYGNQWPAALASPTPTCAWANHNELRAIAVKV